MKEPRMIFGFALLGVLFLLSAAIALGKVSEQTSFGLQIVLGSLATLAGGFAQWAFSNRNSTDGKGDKQE